VVDKACAAARRFEAARAAAFGKRRAGREPFLVSVNGCGQGLAFDGFLDRVTSSLRAGGMGPGVPKPEITETTLMATGADEVLRGARDFGIGVALDDFGTGHSSLSYLHRFPIDTLKLDRSFLTDADTAEPPPILVGILRLAELLGMPVVAEESSTGRRPNSWPGSGPPTARDSCSRRPYRPIQRRSC
jgi:EAL domain-containing protein (putative c-di-GMP-specific phosphodiesterase class I)